jgi:hypothetical protein
MGCATVLKRMGARTKPAVRRNLPIKVPSQGGSSSGITLQDTSSSSKPMEGASSSGIPPQGATNSSKPMEEVDIKLVASKVSKLHLGKAKLSENTTRNPKS